MSGFDANIPTKFFGLNKQEVEKYFRDLGKEQDKLIEELSKQKKRLDKEKDKLLADLTESKKEIIEYQDEIAPKSDTKNEVVNNAVERLEKTASLIKMLAEEETEQMAKKASEKLAEYDEIIAKLQEEIDENKAKIESMLSNVLKLLKSNVDNISDKKQEFASEKADISKQLLPAKKEMQSFRDKLNENKSFLEKSEKDKITADGTSLSDINKLLMFRKKYASRADEDEEEENEVNAAFAKKKTPKDELYDIINGYDIDDEFDAKVPKMQQNSGFQFEQEAAPTQKSFSSNDNSSKSETEIKQMRNALIVGKISGEDLLDSNNNVIISSGKVLTEQDIVLAESVSKLPELIINMILPN